MSRFKPAFAVMCLCLTSTVALAAKPAGLMAEWTFDEGKGDVAGDSSGHGRDAKVFGASWVKQGDGFALSLDGVDDYVEFAKGPPLGLTGPVTIEAWVKPMRKAEGLSCLLGQDLHSFLLTFYAIDHCFWYIGAGSNNVSAKINLNEWNHIAATFDGERMGLWLNGQQAAGRESKFKGYKKSDVFCMGTKGRPDLPKFKGLLDNVRVYDRALTEDEIVTHVKAESADHGISIFSSSVASAPGGTEFFKSHPNMIDLEQRGNSILFANKQIGLEIGKAEHGFQINRLYGIADDQDFLVSDKAGRVRELFEIRMTPDLRGSGRDERWKTKGSLMGIIDEMAADAFSVGSQTAKSVSWKRQDGDGKTTLRLNWHKIPVRGNIQLIDVEVTVTLRPGDPLSYWRINVKNPGTKFGIERVRFPLLNLAPIGDAKQNVYIYPREHGGYIEDPFNARTGFYLPGGGGYYPIDFNMQFQALYDKSSGHGIYLATQDSTPNLMHMQIANTPKQITWKPGHLPPNMTFAEEDYSLPYDCVAGPFNGDWYDACRIYRKWALKQSWCRKGPLLTREDVPKWYKEAPFMFYTAIGDSAEGTHSMSENARIAANHFREFLKWADMPLPANWYSWSEDVRGMTSFNVPFGSHRRYNQGRWVNMISHTQHSGIYPTIGALKAFTEETHKLRKEGGMICPYIALEIFDQGPDENAPLALEARPHVVRDLFGVKRTWGNLTAWQICTSTSWWQNRMRETCELMVQREHVGGFYLDVMQGAGLPCYWTPHGHSACGGDAITTGMHKTVEGCFNAAKAQDPETIITGENSTESVIDVIDGILQITLWPENRAHIFAAVYQDYVKRYGLELSTGVGWKGRFKNAYDEDAFFIECASLFAQGAQIGRIRLRPRDAALSLTNPDQKHMVDFLNQVLGYYKNDTTRMFHAYGQFMRPLTFTEPSPMPMMTYKRGGEFPTLWSGVFRNVEGELGVFIVNAGKGEMAFQADMELARHGMAEGVVVDVDTIAPDGATATFQRAVKGAVELKGSLPGRGITMFRLSPITDRE